MFRALIFSVLGWHVTAYYEDDCFRQTEFYGGITNVDRLSSSSPDVVVKSDLAKLRALDRPLDY